MNILRLKKLLLHFTFILIAFFFSPATVAQIIIEEDDPNNEGSSSFRLLDYLSGDFSYSTSTGAIDRFITLGSLAFNYQLLDNKVTLYAAVTTAESEIKFTQELTSEKVSRIALGLDDPLPATRSATVTSKTDPGFEYSVSYIPNSYVSGETGFFTPDLGQFGFISPVSLLLPIDSETNGFGFKKNDLFVPQNNINVVFYPLPNLELSYYKAVGDISLSGITYSFIGEDLAQEDDAVLSNEQVADILSHKANEYFRIVWQPSWGAVGFTSFSGSNSFAHITEDRVQCRLLTSGASIDQYPLCPTTKSEITESDKLVFVRSNSGQVKLPDSEAIGFEVAVNFGRRTLIFEMTQAKYASALSGLHESFETEGCTSAEILAETFNISCPNSDIDRVNYYNWFETGGRLNLETEEVIWSLGYESRSENGSSSLSLQLIGIDTSADLGAIPETWRAINMNRNQDQFDTFVIPSFLYTKDYDVLNRRNTFVTGVGFFGSYAGVFANNIINFNDNFSAVIGLSGVQNAADEQVADESGDQDYEFSSDFELGFALGIAVTF